MAIRVKEYHLNTNYHEFSMNLSKFIYLNIVNFVLQQPRTNFVLSLRHMSPRKSLLLAFLPLLPGTRAVTVS